MRNVKKRTLLCFIRTFMLMVGLYFGMGTLSVQAAQSPVSHGNLIYEDKRGSANLCAADILLLDEKISSIPERCFDPLCYAHTHHWEYRDINETTHTRHCADCGEANDLTAAHKAERWERDTIFYEGKSYPAKRFICACGYQWRMESTHNMIYETVNEVSHRSRCALDGTPYCTGCEPYLEEHYAWYYEMNGDDAHHTKICFDCGYQDEEECCFFEDEEGDGASACICGRTAQDDPDTGDGTEVSAQSDSEDETNQPDLEDEKDTPDQPDPEDTQDTPDQPDPEDTQDTPDQPDAEDDSGQPDQPDPGDTPAQPDPENASDTPDSSNAGDAPAQPDSENASDAPDPSNAGNVPAQPDLGNASDTHSGQDTKNAPDPSAAPQTGNSRPPGDDIIIISEYVELIPLY